MYFQNKNLNIYINIVLTNYRVSKYNQYYFLGGSVILTAKLFKLALIVILIITLYQSDLIIMANWALFNNPLFTNLFKLTKKVGC